MYISMVLTMDITHTFSFPLSVNPQRLDPIINREWIAMPLTRNKMGLWKTSISHNQKSFPIELQGHEMEINSFSLSNKIPTKYLATSCKKKILLWDLNVNREEIKSKTFIHKANETYAMCFNNSDDVIAVAADRRILILNFVLSETVLMFDAHRAIITKLKFCPHYSSTLISISDDSSFCVWNVDNKCLIYQSTMVSSSPLLSLTMNLILPQVIIGSANGCLKVFDLTDGNNFRQLTSLELSMCLKKKMEDNIDEQKDTNAKGFNKNQNQETNFKEISPVIHSSESVLSIEFIYSPQSEKNMDSTPIVNNTGMKRILEEKPPKLCVITTSSIILINSKTFEIAHIVNFRLSLKSLSFSSSITVGPVAFAGICQIDTLKVIAVVGSMMYNKIDVLRCELSDQNMFIKTESHHHADDELSIVPKVHLLPGSPLSSDSLPPVHLKNVTMGDIGTRKSRHVSLNQPLTFKSKIKSSGYLQAPRAKMFSPQTDKQTLLNIGISPTNKTITDKKMFVNKTFKSEYDVSKGPPVEHYNTLLIDVHATAVSHLKFSDDGDHLACALTNKSGLIMKSPYKNEITTSLTGHNSIVNSVYWSNSGLHVLTASNDKTACLWSRAGGDPLINLTHTKKSVKVSAQGKSTNSANVSLQRKSSGVRVASTSLSQLSVTDNLPYSKEIKNTQFFYVDKFILLIQGSEMFLYKYNIMEKKDDIKRFQSQNRYKVVTSWQTKNTSFTSMIAVNSFYSYLVFCTTSGRSIEVYDLNRSSLAHNFSDCHSRPAHCVTINECSCFSSQPQEALNVFATAAVTDPIKLWDVRSKSSVQSMQGHLNNAHSCHIAFSPCGNYLVSGSEDRTVYMYDLRMGTFCDRLKGHNEVITSVAFHPAKPFLATGSLNSKIVFFKTK